MRLLLGLDDKLVLAFLLATTAVLFQLADLAKADTSEHDDHIEAATELLLQRKQIKVPNSPLFLVNGGLQLRTLDFLPHDIGQILSAHPRLSTEATEDNKIDHVCIAADGDAHLKTPLTLPFGVWKIWVFYIVTQLHSIVS